MKIKASPWGGGDCGWGASHPVAENCGAVTQAPKPSGATLLHREHTWPLRGPTQGGQAKRDCRKVADLDSLAPPLLWDNGRIGEWQAVSEPPPPPQPPAASPSSPAPPHRPSRAGLTIPRPALEGGVLWGAPGTQDFAHQKWPKQTCPSVHFIFPQSRNSGGEGR